MLVRHRAGNLEVSFCQAPTSSRPETVREAGPFSASVKCVFSCCVGASRRSRSWREREGEVGRVCDTKNTTRRDWLKATTLDLASHLLLLHVHVHVFRPKESPSQESYPTDQGDWLDALWIEGRCVSPASTHARSHLWPSLDGLGSTSLEEMRW